MNGTCTAGGSGANASPSPDNGNGNGAGSGGGANATGTWNDPIPFGSDTSELAPGTIIWIPMLQKYFVMETNCTACDAAWSNGQQHEVSLWTGMASASNMYSEENCETFLGTKIVTKGSPAPIIVAPPSNEPVNTMPLFNTTTSGCFPGGLQFVNQPNSQQIVGINSSPIPSASPSSAPSGNVPPPSGMQLVGFWDSWSDTSIPLSSVPAAVNVVDVAFAETTSGSSALSGLNNTNPISSSSVHANGGKLMLSVGGQSYAAMFTQDPTSIVNAINAYLQANPGVYDGVDIDDEQDPRNNQTLVTILQQLRAAHPSPFLITYDAFPSGANTGTGTSDWDGVDRAIASQVSGDIDWVNVMDYYLGSWKPQGFTSCVNTPGASDDCTEDVIVQFGQVFPKGKVVMGIMDTEQGGITLTPSNASAYAAWVKSNGYGGMMLWDLKGDPGWSFVNAMAGGL